MHWQNAPYLGQVVFDKEHNKGKITNLCGLDAAIDQWDTHRNYDYSVVVDWESGQITSTELKDLIPIEEQGQPTIPDVHDWDLSSPPVPGQRVRLNPSGSNFHHYEREQARGDDGTILDQTDLVDCWPRLTTSDKRRKTLYIQWDNGHSNSYYITDVLPVGEQLKPKVDERIFQIGQRVRILPEHQNYHAIYGNFNGNVEGYISEIDTSTCIILFEVNTDSAQRIRKSHFEFVEDAEIKKIRKYHVHDVGCITRVDDIPSRKLDDLVLKKGCIITDVVDLN